MSREVMSAVIRGATGFVAEADAKLAAALELSFVSVIATGSALTALIAGHQQIMTGYLN